MGRRLSKEPERDAGHVVPLVYLKYSKFILIMHEAYACVGNARYHAMSFQELKKVHIIYIHTCIHICRSTTHVIEGNGDCLLSSAGLPSALHACMQPSC
jgi:hypothetical protein